MNAQTPMHERSEPLPVLPTHRAEELTEGGNLAQIALGHQLYTLRITRAGKLILTK
ncbi:Hemin uptake protein HemP [Cribrihabitans marinus]|uniref:Hemin uptake protein HemP n=1 Tax=Cribrihabitans marinus TaxID=1227549 RepID=A0A1H7BZB1_9RHOB|nr:hemin uptake protein HemP [Cribrihabitans marinus]GGH34177.1 hemin uptake protein HemP [Cribrihabitans marinus]SEJ78685.1 Hemin uptake protein HemP [Cribrihabitans marinus]